MERSSSTYRDGIYSYQVENLHDRRKDTVWVEGARGPGIGEKVSFDFDFRQRADDNFGVNWVSVLNGFARSPDLWQANSRVRELRLTFNGEEKGTIQLEDLPDPQTFELPEMTFQPGEINTLTFESVSVYPGTQFPDHTALADFRFSGFGDIH